MSVHVRPGYFKPDPPLIIRGVAVRRRFRKSPRVWIKCHGNLLGRFIYHNGMGYVVADVTCPGAKRKRKRRRGRNKRKLHVSQNYGRYRDRNPELLKLGELPPNAQLGTWRVYSGGQVSQSSVLKTTGLLGGALSYERCWDQVNPGPPYLDFGPFAKVQTTITGHGKSAAAKYKSSIFSPGNWWEYEGSFADDGFWGGDSLSNHLSASIPTIAGYDTLAWDKTKPIIPQANGAQFIAELRDLPRMLETTANTAWNVWRSFGGGYSGTVMAPGAIADNFLNHEFGWAPFLSDYVKFLRVMHDSAKFIERLARDNGRWVTRRAILKNDVVQERVARYYSPGVVPFGFQIQGLCTPITVDGISCTGYMDLTRVTKTRVWAVGSFRYYRPEFDDNDPSYTGIMNALRRQATLYGLRISPSVVYKVTPWSWAIDWGSRLGSHIERLDDYIVDGIVARKLFVMCTTETTLVKTSVVNFSTGARTFAFKRQLASKVRKVADSPYGFDRPWASLTPKQLAIAAAVGFTNLGSGFVSRG